MSAKIASMSKLNFAANISRVRCTSATIGSSHMTLFSHEFFWGANGWHFAAQLLTHHCYSPGDLRRKDASSHDGLRQRIGVIGDRQSRQPADDREPLLNFRRIADQ